MIKEVNGFIAGTIDVMRARGDLRRYSEVDPGTPTTLFETFMLYCIRRRFDVPQNRIAEHLIPSTLAGVRQLFEAYDDVVDGATSFPDISTVKTHEGLQQKLRNVIEIIMDAPVQRDQKQQIMSIINRERQCQYALEQQYGQQPQPLSGVEAISWREQSGGSFFALFPRIAAVQLDADSERSEPMVNAAYLYGANLQLLDDLVDVGRDVRDGRQNALVSCMLETAGEYEEIKMHINETQHALTFRELSELVPSSLERIEDARARYYHRIPNGSRLPIFDVMCNPKHTSAVMRQYRSRTSYK